MKVFIIGGPTDRGTDSSEQARRKLCRSIGRSLANAGHALVLCSPFPNAADIEVLHGAASTIRGRSMEIEFHFPDDDEVRVNVEDVVDRLKLRRVHRIPHAPWQNDTEDARRYAWLLCQLRALDSSNVTIAVGGHVDGSADMLLQVADGKRKPVLPLPLLGGAAKLSYERRRYELEDKLGRDFIKLQNKDVEDSLESMIEAVTVGVDSALDKPSNEKVFISYPRARQAEADHVETLLRRRNISVFRDENDFGAGHSVVERIREALFESSVFVALWSAEYACSPWCFDEFELALDRNSKKKMDLWIIRTDETRIVPTRARSLIYHTALTRLDLENRIIALIDERIRRFDGKAGMRLNAEVNATGVSGKEGRRSKKPEKRKKI